MISYTLQQQKKNRVSEIGHVVPVKSPGSAAGSKAPSGDRVPRDQL